MEFEWDEEKRRKNIEKHRIDFNRMRLLFDGRPVVIAEGNYLGEERWVIVRQINQVFYSVVWTRRGEAIRIISARRSRDAEKREYREVHGG